MMAALTFIASLAPGLPAEIFLTAVDQTLMSSLPPNLVAIAKTLHNRARVERRRAVPVEVQLLIHDSQD